MPGTRPDRRRELSHAEEVGDDRRNGPKHGDELGGVACVCIGAAGVGQVDGGQIR